MTYKSALKDANQLLNSSDNITYRLNKARESNEYEEEFKMQLESYIEDIKYFLIYLIKLLS